MSVRATISLLVLHDFNDCCHFIAVLVLLLLAALLLIIITIVIIIVLDITVLLYIIMIIIITVPSGLVDQRGRIYAMSASRGCKSWCWGLENQI